MKTEDWTEFKKDFDDAKTWSTRPETFVDLNEPVIRGEKVYYPIVHPMASVLPEWSRPLGGDQDGVEGFRYNKDGEELQDTPGSLGEKAAKVAEKSAGVETDGHVAMPVRWIYQLADGTLGSLEDFPSGGGSGGPGFGFKSFVGNVEPSEKNPMVARFAFWADDETTKLNVNVHAGGVAWDIPKAGGALDRAMGEYQPAAKEFQRYAGHPASTHLGPALAPGLLDVVKEKRAMELLYDVVPRIVGGGSEAGTRIINTNDPKERNGLVADTEPLFPSLDDVIMRSDREPHKYPDGTTGNAVPPDQLSEYLERAKFFVTVNSRAPETNIFNKPKIAMWPIFNAPENSEAGSAYQTKLTAFDRLIHYCSSMGKSTGEDYERYKRHEYIFKRENPHSPTDDYTKIPRNEALYKYLIALTKKPIPGYGKSYSEKYGGASTAQLITMMFDYIRMTNLHDDTLFEEDQDAFQVDIKDTYLTYTNPRDKNDTGFGLKGHGQVSPIEIEGTKGMGRFYSLSGAHILLTCVGMPGFLPNNLYAGAQALETSKPYENAITLDQGAGDLYTNLPPLPANVTEAGDQALWPSWLKSLRLEDPVEFKAAFEPNNWNWQLAFMDTGYRNEVLALPTANKFNRALITLASCENMRLKPNERLVQAIFLFDLFSPSIGWNSINPNMEIRIKRNSGMTFDGVDGPVGFLGFGDGGTYNKAVGAPDTFIWATNWSKPGTGWGGFLPFQYTLQGVGRNDDKSPLFNIQNILANRRIRSRLTPLDKGYDQLVSGVSKVQSRQIGGQPADIAQAYRYDLVTYPFKVPYQGGNKTLKFGGGEVNFQVFDRSKHTESSQPSLRTDGTTPVQDVTIEFDKFEFLAPLMSPGQPSWVDEYNNLSRDTFSALELASLTADPGSIVAPTGISEGKVRTRTGAMHSRVRTARAKVPVNSNNPVTSFGRMALIGSNASGSWGGLFVARNDILQSVAVGHGDMRLAASKPVITEADKIFQEHRLYNKEMMAHSLTNANGWPVGGMSRTPEYYIVPDLPNGAPPYRTAPYHRTVPMPFATEKSRDVQLYGDFDNGAGTMIDGAYINKPDEGNVHGLNGKFANAFLPKRQSNQNSNGSFPYFSSPHLNEPGGPAYFSPNRMVSGPGMFGSLPTGLADSPPKPWQTLLFRPNVEGNYYTSHPGAGKDTGTDAVDPPDHLLMDLFWMPVVEPYAISEPLSTAGKVNMNYQIVPFLHIHRDTALRGVFRSEFMLCVPNKWNGSYKYNFGRGIGYNARYDPKGGVLEMLRLRSAIEDTATLNQFLTRFNKGAGMFKSSSEICEIHLIPEDVSSRIFQSKTSAVGTYTPTVEQMKSGKYWRDHALVGDNSRERPYTNIQTRLTTKSNTFLVHYRAQVIKQSRRESAAGYGQWRPAVDTVQAEYRGSSLVERYVNPNDKDIPDFADEKEKDRSIDEFYNYRVVNPRRFAP
jgi:hypothetical protein